MYKVFIQTYCWWPCWVVSLQNSTSIHADFAVILHTVCHIIRQPFSCHNTAWSLASCYTVSILSSYPSLYFQLYHTVCVIRGLIPVSDYQNFRSNSATWHSRAFTHAICHCTEIWRLSDIVCLLANNRIIARWNRPGVSAVQSSACIYLSITSITTFMRHNYILTFWLPTCFTGTPGVGK